MWLLVVAMIYYMVKRVLLMDFYCHNIRSIHTLWHPIHPISIWHIVLQKIQLNRANFALFIMKHAVGQCLQVLMIHTICSEMHIHIVLT